MTYRSYYTEDRRNLPQSSVHSMIPAVGMIKLGGYDSPLAEAILNRIKHDAYKINIVPTDSVNYHSMRKVYGLDPALSE